MNISSFNPIIGNIHNQNTVNKRGKFNNLSPLVQDTISFGASASTRKLVDDLKKLNPTGTHCIKFSDVEKVYEYFGYKKPEEGHTKFTGPYGQYANFKKQNPVDPNTAKDLIRSLKHVDDFQGELIIFDHEPTTEEITEWQQRISTRTPYDGYVNQYAIDNKDRLQTVSSPIEEVVTTSVDKEQDKAVNELKGKISLLLVSISQKQEDFDALVGAYNEIKEVAKQNKIEFPQDTIQILDDQIKAKSEEFSTAKTNLETYKEKLSKNNMLSDEEKNNIDMYENEVIDFSDIEESIINIEEIYSSESEKQTQLTEQVIEAITQFDVNDKAVQEQLLNISGLIDEASKFPHMKKGVVEKLNKLYSTIEKKLKKINNKIDEYRSVEQNKTSISRLDEILKKVGSINATGFATSIPELVEINSLLATEVTPIITVTEDEKVARGIEQIEKFNRRASQAQRAIEQTTTGNKPVEQSVEPKIEEQSIPIVPKVEEQPTVIEQKIEVPPATTASTITFDPPLTKNITTNTSLIEKRTQLLKSKLTEKIMPLQLPSVKGAVAELVNGKFNSASFNEVQNGSVSIQEFAKDLASSVVKTDEFSRVKNSARFAFLNGVYDASTNKPEEIFALNGKESRELYKAIQDGKKEISVASINIALGSNVNLDAIDSKFNEYNTKLDSIDKKKSEQIADEVLKYMPPILDKDFALVLLKLSNEGTYYELLLDDECPEKLRTTLLETFWKKVDSDNGTNYAPTVMKNYTDEQQRIKEAEMQKRKLESIKKIDWTL